MASAENDKRWFIIVLVACGGLLLFAAASAFLPHARLWGINHLAYYPLSVRVVLLAAAALCFAPWIAERFHSGLVRAIELLRESRLGALALVVVPLLSFFVFMSLQSATLVLGDGQVVVNDIEARYRGDSTAVGPTLQAIAAGDHIAPGTTMMHYLTSVASMRAGGSAADAPRLVSCIFGALFVLLLLVAIRRAELRAEMVVWLLAFVCSCGAIQLFFGYVENYAPLFVLGSLYVLSAFYVLDGRGSIWLPVGSLVVAVCTHVSGILLLPSLVILLLHRARGKSERASTMTTVIILALIAVVVTLAATLTPLGGRFFVPWHTSKDAYGFFSPARWADIANELLLLFPLVFVVAAMAFVPLENVESKSERRARVNFVLLIVVPQLIYIIFFNPEIGMGRDWDLFAFAALGLIPLALLAVTRFERACPRAVTRILLPCLAIGLLLNSAWIGINASHARSTERFENILDYTHTRRDYAYEVLGMTYYDHGMIADAIRSMEKGAGISQNPRHFFLLAGYYREYGDMAASAELLRRTLVRRPTYLPARQDYVSTLHAMRDYEAVLRIAQEGLQYHPHVAFFHLYAGKALIELARPDAAREMLLEGRALRSDPEVRREIDSELRRLGNK